MLRSVSSVIAIALVLTVFTAQASASWWWWPKPPGPGGGDPPPASSSVPEIDPAAATGALTLLVTGVAMLRQRSKKKS